MTLVSQNATERQNYVHDISALGDLVSLQEDIDNEYDTQNSQFQLLEENLEEKMQDLEI